MHLGGLPKLTIAGISGIGQLISGAMGQ